MGSISHIRLREGIFFSSSQFLLGFFLHVKSLVGFFLVLFLIWCDRGGNRLRSLRYVRYATIATLRYATDRRGQKEERRGVFCWCRIERERGRERRRKRRREDIRDIPEKRRLSTKEREKYNPEKQDPERERRRRRSRHGNNSIMLRNHSHHKLPRSVPPQSIPHK